MPELFDPIDVVRNITYEMAVMVNAKPDVNDLCNVALTILSKMIIFGRVSKKHCQKIVPAILNLLDSRSDRILGKTSKKYAKLVTFDHEHSDNIDKLYMDAKKLFLDVESHFPDVGSDGNGPSKTCNSLMGE